jgi:hypothetical protein
MEGALIEAFRGFLRYRGAGSIRLSDAVADEAILQNVASALNAGEAIAG